MPDQLEIKKYLKTIAVLAGLGMLFSGYLSWTKIFNDSCAFGVECPYFLGYPACYFGFLLFTTMFGIAIAGYYDACAIRKVIKLELFVGALGVIFSSQYVVEEVLYWLSEGFEPSILLLPACIYGFIFYFLIFFFSLRMLRRFRLEDTLKQMERDEKNKDRII